MADTFKIKKAKSVFRRALRTAPAHPRGDRILVRAQAPESESEGGIAYAEKAKERPMVGWIVTAGLKALDVMYDNDDQIGDMILYAKYAGCVEDWKHIVGPDDVKCPHDGAKDYVPQPSAVLEGLGSKRDPAVDRKWACVPGGPTDNVTLQECRACGTLIVTERMIVMNVEDIMLNIDSQERLESGEISIVRGVDPDGRTQHVIERAKQTKKEAA